VLEPVQAIVAAPFISPQVGPHTLTALLADSVMLVSWWKPLIILMPFVAWGWIVSEILDKHAARFFLPREGWGLAHLVCGLFAAALGFFMPVPGILGFVFGLLAVIVILGADIGAFVISANKDERVPEEKRLKLDFSKLAAGREAKSAAKKAGKVELAIRQPDKALFSAPLAETPEFEVRVAAEQLFIRARDARASQVELLPTGNKDGGYGAVMLIDGVKQAGEQMPAANAIKVIDFWKTAAKLDVNDRRKRLMDDATVERNEKKTKVRVTSQGIQGGMRLTMLFDFDTAVKRKAENLGLLEPQMAELVALTAKDEHGVVLLGGTADGGRTTTMYSIVRMHDAYTTNVQTVETEIQDTLEGVRQNKYDAQSDGPEYSTLVRSILRRDPDVVAMAELIDQNTAKEIARADQERTRTYISVKADNSIAAVEYWVKTVGELEAAAKCLRGVVACRLVRKLCTNCRVPYAPTPDILKKLGLPADKVKQLFKKGGQVIIKKDPETCPICQGTGYVGQEGVWEVFKIGQPERELIQAGNFNGLRAEFRKRQLPTIQMSALRKAVDGTTSVEEIMRVTAASPPAGPKPVAPVAGAAATPAAALKPQAKPPAKPPVQSPAQPPAQPPAKS